VEGVDADFVQQVAQDIASAVQRAVGDKSSAQSCAA
jgi:hypothetical protein